MTFRVLLKQDGVEDPGQAILRVSCDFIKALHRTGFSKALAKLTRESTQVNASFWLAFNLTLRLATHLCDWSCVDFSRAQSRRNLFSLWPPNASRHNLIASHLYMREMYHFAICMNLRAELRVRFASTRAHTYEHQIVSCFRNPGLCSPQNKNNSKQQWQQQTNRHKNIVETFVYRCVDFWRVCAFSTLKCIQWNASPCKN